ncbi:potassium channel family protein [Mycoplasma sp. 2045]|uniref:potassium channel family protein n=1 Tax=Mycoplasma sp. 2045 TaxID=2967301 RepID=UPI00211BB3C3|nr:potassium channel family protein [Mycoplasma sp. 2045]UUM20337.1 potassium channel family protein [Mycoplasma sp. 2045]
MFKIRNLSKNTWKGLAHIIWSNSNYDDNLSPYSKRIQLFSYIYAAIITFACLVSFFSLITVKEGPNKAHFDRFLVVVQVITFFIFIVDYFLHFITYKYLYTDGKTKVWKIVLKYIFSFNGICILFCILASLYAISFLMPASEEIAYNKNEEAKIFHLFKSFNVFKIIRFFFVLTLFAPFQIIINVFKKQRQILTYIFILILILIFLFALLIWNNEKNHLKQSQIQYIIDHKWDQTFNLEYFKEINNQEYIQRIQDATTSHDKAVVIFDYLSSVSYADLPNDNIIGYMDGFLSLESGYVTTFGSSLYYVTITLTTIGYGDFTPHASITRGIISFLSLMSVAIIAIPSGLIAGAFLVEMQKHISTTGNKKSRFGFRKKSDDADNQTNQSESNEPATTSVENSQNTQETRKEQND